MSLGIVGKEADEVLFHRWFCENAGRLRVHRPAFVYGAVRVQRTGKSISPLQDPETFPIGLSEHVIAISSLTFTDPCVRPRPDGFAVLGLGCC